MNDFTKLGDEISLQLMITKRVREPTLWEVQKGIDNDKQMRFESTPSWLLNFQAHPGLPEHYITKWKIENLNKSADEILNLPKLPFSVNREILQKLLIIPTTPESPPKLTELRNGTIIVVGGPLQEKVKHNIEIFLSLRDKLLPCCYCLASEVITRTPSTISGLVRCYYVPDGKKEISFISSNEQLIQKWNNYRIKLFCGSTPYEVLREEL